MLNWVKRLLSAQQKLDFKPEDIKADEGIAAANSTNVCVYKNTGLLEYRLYKFYGVTIGTGFQVAL